MRRLVCLCLALSMVFGLFPFISVSADSDMKASDDCLELIKQFEGFSAKPYMDTDGLYTIGYGTRCPSDKVQYYYNNPMSVEEATQELRREIVTYEDAVNKFLNRHGVTFQQQQFDAVVSLIFNVGGSWLTKGDTLINALVSGATGNELINAFTIYSMSGGSRSVGHVLRRLSEANVYLTGVYSRTLPDNLGYVLYDGCGGTLEGYNVQGYDGNIYTVPQTIAKREGYVFKGWSLTKEGGAPIKVLNATTRNKTLYAQWEKEQIWPPPLPVAPDGTLQVSITGDSVNVRQGAGLDYSVVTSVKKGTVVSVFEIRQVDGYTWGALENGWIALEFTDYDFETAITCIHSYEIQSQTEPTCTADGLVVYACTKCGLISEQVWSCVGHFYASATCTEPKTCKICGDRQGQANGHSYAAASCTLPETCMACGDTQGSALGHSYGEPTCTQPAKCSRCGQTGAAALGHQYDSIGKCTACGALDPSLGGTIVTVTGEKVNIRAGASLTSRVVGFASVGEQLRITETCQANGYLWGRFDSGWLALKYTDYKGDVTTPCQHNYKALAQKDATCTQSGSLLYSCTHCQATRLESVDPLGHSYESDSRCVRCDELDPDYYTVIVTVTGTGVNLRSGAGLSYSKTGYATVGDKLTITATKQNDGYLWGQSPRGWIALKYTNYDQVSSGICQHSYQLLSKVEPTCSQQGISLYSCSRCGDTYSETLGVKAHSYKDATCSTPKTCTQCGSTSGFALGHSYGDNGICGRCGTKDPEYSVSESKIYATVINTDTLNVRSAPNGTIVGKLYRGNRVEITEQKRVAGGLWGRFEGGWIYIEDYGKLEMVTDRGTFQLGIVTATALNVRLEAGVGNSVIGLLYSGDVVIILEKKTVNGALWAKTDLGWVSMTYVK